MKTYLKSILGLVLLTLGLFAASAQQYSYTALNTATGTESTIPASAATNINATFTATKYDEFVLSCSFKLMGAGTSSLDFVWQYSPDGTAWTSVKNGDSHGWFVGPSGNGTSTVYWNTNITLKTHGYYRISYITNGSAAVVTNLNLRAYVKPRTRG